MEKLNLKVNPVAPFVCSNTAKSMIDVEVVSKTSCQLCLHRVPSNNLLLTNGNHSGFLFLLFLLRMVLSDSGPYTCSPAGGENATISIEVKEVKNRWDIKYPVRQT